MKCFAGSVPGELLDLQPFSFAHTLVGHAAASFDYLAGLLPNFSPSQVFFAPGPLSEGDDFEQACVQRRQNFALPDMVDALRRGPATVVVRGADAHAALAPLLIDLCADAAQLMGVRRVGRRVEDASLSLWMAGPGAVLPFHLDRRSTLAMQLCGTCEVGVFPQWDSRVVSARVREGFVAQSGVRPEWRAEALPLATRFSINAGDALHVPFVAGRYVRNGPQEVSVALCFQFNTRETLRQTQAMRLNQYLRAALRPVGLAPRPVGDEPLRDRLKARVWCAGVAVSRSLGRP
jgi:hypothetical protein